MSLKKSKIKQLSLDFHSSPEPKDPSAEHDQGHEPSDDAPNKDFAKAYSEIYQDEAAYGENPPLPYSASISASHGTDMVERDLAYRLVSDPKACAKHIEEGLHTLANEPSENNRLALRRRLRDVARAWDIPVSGKD